MYPYEEIAIYRQLVEQIRNVCDDQREAIDSLVAEAEAKINAPPIYKCKHCCDTGYEDVRGECRCRNNCPPR